MGDLALGDLYEVAAHRLSGSQINRNSEYQCRFCPNFEISGVELCDSAAGQSHAAAHRIAFEALLEPSSFLNCPICDEPQYSKQASSAIIFDCMFNDLDLVNHLISEHGDMLSDELVGEFADVTYLLTTFKEKTKLPHRPRSNTSACAAASESCSQSNSLPMEPTNHDRNGQRDRVSVCSQDSGVSDAEVHSSGSQPMDDIREEEELEQIEGGMPSTSTQQEEVMREAVEEAEAAEDMSTETVTDETEDVDEESMPCSSQPCQPSNSTDSETIMMDEREAADDGFREVTNSSASTALREEANETQVLTALAASVDGNTICEQSEVPTSAADQELEQQGETVAEQLNSSQTAPMIEEPGPALSQDQMPELERIPRPPVSRISCSKCDWEAVWLSNASELRKSIASHLRLHIREESEKRLNDPNVFYAAKRLLCCMDFSLEEYFEKEQLTDLSESVNAPLMEKTYHELLVKLFGISLPLVMRILHGTRGNPFKRQGRRQRVKKQSKNKDAAVVVQLDDSDDDINETVSYGAGYITESSDHENADESGLVEREVSESMQLVHCTRPECGHSVLNSSDEVAVTRHVAAHIRHDELRLQRTAPALICHCGMAAYSPIGYVYHVFRDHVFEKKPFTSAAKTVMSYVVLLFDSMFRAGADGALARTIDVNWKKMKTRMPLWCAHFALENDEGEEMMWSDCSNLNQDWMRLWSDFVEEDSEASTGTTQQQLSVGDVIKLFEMHPFVESLTRPARKRRSYPMTDEKTLLRYLGTTWRQLTNWESAPLMERERLGPTQRWVQLHELRKRVTKENKNGSVGANIAYQRYVHPGGNHVESIVVTAPNGNAAKTEPVSCSGRTTDVIETEASFRLLPPGVTDLRSTIICGSSASSHVGDQDQEEDIEDEMMDGQEEPTAVGLGMDDSAENPSRATSADVRDDTVEGSAADLDIDSQANSVDGMNDASTSHQGAQPTVSAFSEDGPLVKVTRPRIRTTSGVNCSFDPGLRGKWVACRMCERVTMRADDVDKIRTHCAVHAVAEARLRCSLYIHRHSDVPITCPFCSYDICVSAPLVFIKHLLDAHSIQSRTLYDSFLYKVLPRSNYISEAFDPADDATLVSEPASFLIRCERSVCCGRPEVVMRLQEGGRVVDTADVDDRVLKHMLWHVKNDTALRLTEKEGDLMSRALMTRLTGKLTARQIPFMAREALKGYSGGGLVNREADVVRFVVEKTNEIGRLLFGSNQGLVFSMVFPRRFVRDQCGLSIYPPCVCRLCIDRELPRNSSDRRKRAFVAYAHPVVQHVLEHMTVGDLGKQLARQRRCQCPLDDISFRNVSMAIKHVLDAHNDAVVVNTLPILLEDMGVLGIFVGAVDAVLGDQAWQLKEALGFEAFSSDDTQQATFFDQPDADADPYRGHRADCLRRSGDHSCNCILVSAVTCSSAVISSSPGVTGGAFFSPSTMAAPLPARVGLASAITNAQKRVEDLPSQSMAFYREFLETDDDGGGGGLGGAADINVSSPSAPLAAPSPFSPGDSTTSAVSMLFNADPQPESPESTMNVKREPLEVLPTSEMDLQAAALSPVTAATAVPTIASQMRTLEDALYVPTKAQRARLVKAAKEIKQEPGVIQPRKALPLKNVIQGPKTVSAAVAAALGADSADLSLLRRNPAVPSSSLLTPPPRIPSPSKRLPIVTSASPATGATTVVPSVHVTQQKTPAKTVTATTTHRRYAAKRDAALTTEDIVSPTAAAAADDGESDLALGTLVKRVRTTTEPSTTQRKSRSKSNKKKKTTIADLLADDVATK